MTYPGLPAIRTTAGFSSRACYRVPVAIEKVPGMLEAAVGDIPRLSLLDVDGDSAFVARKTRWFGQPARIKFDFTAESASSTIIEADFRESLFGPDLGAASADLLEIFEGLAREVKAAAE